MIVILSAFDDAHLPFVTRHLKDSEYLVIDVREVADGHSLTYHVTEGLLQVSYRGSLLEDVTGVWLRRPTPVKNLSLPVEERFTEYAQSCLARHIRQLYVAFPDALWVSDKYAIDRAENKMLQLQLAAQLGFNVPETLLTSDAEAARAFVQDRPHSIIKPQAGTRPQKENGGYFSYFATKISPKTKVDYDGLDLAPTIFQQAIDPAFDIRVTVVGSKVFSTRIDVQKSKRNKLVRDWRLGHAEGGLTLTSYRLPATVEHQCIALTKKLNLNFGAIDLIQDKKGNIWFLEINPNGQWAFVEEETAQPIGGAIARLLQTNKPYRLPCSGSHWFLLHLPASAVCAVGAASALRSPNGRRVRCPRRCCGRAPK